MKKKVKDAIITDAEIDLSKEKGYSVIKAIKSVKIERLDMGKVIAVVNQKGGVGKTTTAVNIASLIAGKKKRVLVIDVDPQGNSTLGLGFDKEEETVNVYGILIEESPIKSVIKKYFCRGTGYYTVKYRPDRG